MNVRILTLFDEEPMVPHLEPKEKKERPEAKKKPIRQSLATTEAKVLSKAETKETSSEGLINEKNYYTIGETATKFKVRTSHIRFWTVQFGMKVRTTRKGDRLYTPENIEQLKVIHHLVKEQGFTIAGAKLKLKELKNVNLQDLQKNTVIGSLKALRETLITLRNQI